MPAFSAGSHVDVQLSEGVTRQYSLCNDPAESHRYVIAVLKDPNTRGGSKAMHERVQPGDVLTISPPKNHFPLAHGASRSLLLAGGIGVTPILCMAERLSVLGAEFEMHYATRSRGRTAFAARIQQAPYASRVRFHFDDGAPEQKLDVSRVLAAAGDGTHLYVCGPKGFMDHVLSTARAQGWPEDRLHYEFFGTVVVKTDQDQSFRVKLASSGRIILVPKEKTVVQAPPSRRLPSGRRGNVGAPARPPGRGRRDGRHLLRAGRMRNLPHARARRRAGPQGLLPDARRTGCE